MSQIMRATFVSPSFHGISWKVSGSGIATMSDSSIALKPVIEEPSKPMPSSSASPISLGVTAKLFRWPSMSENHSRTNSTPSCSMRSTTLLRVSSLDVALFFVSTCAMDPPLKCKKPQARTPHPRPRCLDDGWSLYLDAMRLLVTGGAGFIGSHFVKRMLAAGEDVVVLDKFTYAGNPANLPGEVDCQRGDIAVREDVDQLGAVDAIVNFAAETHVDRSILGPEDFVRTDVLGTLVLLQAAEQQSARFVQVSTDEVYGDVEPGWSSREDDPLRPSSPYSASKAGGDLQVLAAVRTFGVNASITRGSNTYGPNQYPEKVLPLFVTNALDGHPLPLYGDGRQVRDWLHVDDHCAAIEVVLRQGEAGEVYNVGAGEEHENVELTRVIVEQLGADNALVRHVEDRAGHDRRYSLDTTKIRSLGWQPRRSWDDGGRATIDWYRDNRDWWEPIKRSSGYREYYDRQYEARLN